MITMSKKKPFKVVFSADGSKDSEFVTICDKTINIPLKNLHARVTIRCFGPKGAKKRVYQKNIQSIEIFYDDEGNFFGKKEKVVFT